jgi:hypothetical protein
VAVYITTQELYSILDMTPADENIMLAGKHGIGKSKILSDYFSAKGCKVVPLFLGQMSDPGDLIGLPNKDEKTGRTMFMPPYWFPVDNQPVVLFLDELNRARPEVLQTIMDLALNRTLAGRQLPAGSRIISAVNDGDEYQLTDLDPALVSRFNIYFFRPSAEEWLIWADRQSIDSRITGFIQSDKDELDGSTKETDTGGGLEKTPDRRGWERVSHIIDGTEPLTKIHEKAVAGIIGVKTTAHFFTYISSNRLVSAAEVLSDFDQVKGRMASYKTPDLAFINESLFRLLETKTFSSVTQENCAKRNLTAYVTWLKDTSRNEGLAHFSSLFETGGFKQANTFIARKAGDVYILLTEFIKSL